MATAPSSPDGRPPGAGPADAIARTAASEPPDARGDELRVTLLTGGSPSQLTGGHLFHRRMIDAAPAHGARIETTIVHPLRRPFPRPAGRSVVLVDSLVAARVAPWAARVGHRHRLAAIVHQRPGGVDHGALRTAVQRCSDLALYHRCALLLAVSDAVAADLTERAHIRDDRIVVVTPGCDLPAPAARPDLRHRRTIAVLCVANWLPNKGIAELLDAVAALPPDAVTLHLVGATDADPGYTVLIRERIARRDLADRVVVHGPVDPRELAGMYAAADAFALASRAEAFGIAYAEALQAGLPVVGWRSGNLPNLVDDGVEGCLVDPGDVAGLTEAFARLAGDDDWRVGLAAAARRRATSLPTWNDTATVFFEALTRLGSRHG